MRVKVKNKICILTHHKFCLLQNYFVKRTLHFSKITKISLLWKSWFIFFKSTQKLYIYIFLTPKNLDCHTNLDSSYTTIVCSVPPIPPQGSGGPIPNNVHNDLLKRTPVSSVQTMAQIDPITHHLASNAQASTSGNYEADFVRMKADLNILLGTKLS